MQTSIFKEKQAISSNFRFKKSELGYFKEKDADQATANFDKNCRILGLTNGTFSLIDLIHSILKKTGKANVVIATWSAGIKDVHQVKWMIDSDLINDFKILTDHSYKTRQQKYAASIEELFGLENIRTSEMHAKFVLIYNDSYQVAIRSSMNLNANKTCELFEIDEGNEIFEFLQKYVEFTFENMEFGFVESSSKVNKCVKSFFEANTEENFQPAKHWSEL
jgi:hypothetical protein